MITSFTTFVELETKAMPAFHLTPLVNHRDWVSSAAMGSESLESAFALQVIADCFGGHGRSGAAPVCALEDRQHFAGFFFNVANVHVKKTGVGFKCCGFVPCSQTLTSTGSESQSQADHLAIKDQCGCCGSRPTFWLHVL